MSDNEICTELYLNGLWSHRNGDGGDWREKHQSSNHFFIRNKIRKLMEFLGSPQCRVVSVLILVFVYIFIYSYS